MEPYLIDSHVNLKLSVRQSLNVLVHPVRDADLTSLHNRHLSLVLPLCPSVYLTLFHLSDLTRVSGPGSPLRRPVLPPRRKQPPL